MARRAIIEMPDDRRSERRDCATIVAIHMGERFTTATIRNISTEGAMLDGLRGVAVGSSLQVELPGRVWVDAMVVWVIDPRCGIAFSSPVKLDKVPV